MNKIIPDSVIDHLISFPQRPVRSGICDCKSTNNVVFSIDCRIFGDVPTIWQASHFSGEIGIAEERN
jgi:hypothetical protein